MNKKKKQDFASRSNWSRTQTIPRKKRKKKKSNPEKLLPNNPISASPNGPYRRDVLAGNLEEVAVHIILKVASTMGGYTSDVRLAWARARIHWQAKELELRADAKTSKQNYPEEKRGGGERRYWRRV
jgi:hypothetical protein